MIHLQRGEARRKETRIHTASTNIERVSASGPLRSALDDAGVDGGAGRRPQGGFMGSSLRREARHKLARRGSGQPRRWRGD
jgi:hypothetical protein